MATREELIIFPGSTFAKQWVISDDILEPHDITDFVPNMQIRRFLGDPNPLYDLYELGYLNIPYGVDGEITLEIPNTFTSEMTFNQAVYSLELIDSDGFVETLANGYITVSKEITI